MKNRRWIIVLLVALAVGAYLYSRPTAPDAVSSPATTPPPEPPPKSAATSKKRVSVPRPSSPSRPPKPIRTATAAPATAPQPAEAPSSGLVDRRENPDPDAARELAEIREGMDLVSDDIGECISAWEALYPALNGKVDIAFTLKADGLQEAWIMEATDIPPGPLSCFSAAVWGVEWAGIVRDPVEVTFPFEVRSEEEKDPSKLQ